MEPSHHSTHIYLVTIKFTRYTIIILTVRSIVMAISELFF